MTDDTPDDGSLDRRTYLAALATTAATGLAGCGGGGGGGGGGSGSGGSDGSGSDGGGSQELGERVPAFNGVALGGVAGASGIEQSMLHVQTQLSEILGVRMNVDVKELTTFWNEAYNDARTFNLHVDLSPPFPRNLDPNGMIVPYHIRNAGANGGDNVANYADCEFSELVTQQQSAPNPEQRRELVTEAVASASEDITPITLTTVTNASAFRTDQLDGAEVGEAGPNTRNPEWLWNTSPRGGADGIVSSMTPGNMPSVAYMAGRPSTPWNGTVYLPLVIRDKNYELRPGIATDWTVEDQYQTFTFQLNEEATFHNGEPVTAQDAKWTLEFLDENAAQFPPVASYPYESITAVDETTLEVTMENSQPGWLPGFVPVWSGVLPQDVWVDAGAEDNPTDPDLDEIVGSGPYQVTDFQPRQLLAMEPYEDHFIDVQGNLTYRGFQDNQSARRAFEEGSLNLILNISNETQNQVSEALGDNVRVVSSNSFVSYELRSQHSFAPTMFPEFRHAVSQSINRTLIDQFLNGGDGEPELHSSLLGKAHPWRPDSNDPLTRIADSPTANRERARQILSDAGWGWDNQGRLHYPPDKDLTPQWPEGSSPCENPDDFPCLPELCE
ncbi:ABC transporter substrate-binding protein [Halobellus rubicundus]|uniref:ABC transporter substrate-binding protein n=1 Tax=Halobellus rubicundus TaxID=2996466 RepID=A0ABD5MED3_9EURY